MSLKCGGTSEAEDADEEVQKICDEVSNYTLQRNRNSDVLSLYKKQPWTARTGRENRTCPEKTGLLISPQVKSHAEDKVGHKFDTFTAKCFKTQLVKGKNYFIKVHVGEDDYIHLRVYKTLPHDGEKLELHSIQTSKAHHDAMEHFWTFRKINIFTNIAQNTHGCHSYTVNVILTSKDEAC
ncbi:cystatin-B-like [Pimephales promelas]|uniref:cystatin-B-like n=1 Tax=Pimephales promelas TaxID=90988 RepID=UPI0019554D0C|nr:cystatin-B-like [Pimephales promelas]